MVMMFDLPRLAAGLKMPLITARTVLYVLTPEHQRSNLQYDKPITADFALALAIHSLLTEPGLRLGATLVVAGFHKDIVTAARLLESNTKDSIGLTLIVVDDRYATISTATPARLFDVYDCKYHAQLAVPGFSTKIYNLCRLYRDTLLPLAQPTEG